MERAVFLDRDGVINETVIFPELGILDSPLTPEQFKVIEGTQEGISRLIKLGFKIIIVSNQPGIAKGKISIQNFDNIKNKMKIELQKNGVKIDAEYYCLHHPKAVIQQYKKICSCRKPKPGLLLKASEEFNINLNASYMIGDSWTDIKAGKTVGCFTILIGMIKCDLCKLLEENDAQPDSIVPSLLAASHLIQSREG